MERSRPAENTGRALKLCLAAIASALLVVCVWFVAQLGRSMSRETNRTLEETATFLTSLADYRTESNFSVLESLADVYFQLRDEDREDILQKRAGQSNFSGIAVLDAAGRMASPEGREYDLSGISSVQAALEGQTQVSNLIEDPRTGNKGVVYAVPLLQENSIVGAVAGWVPQEHMRRVVDIGSFGGEGYFQVIDSEGNIVVGSTQKNAAGGEENFFDLIERRGELGRGSSLGQMKRDILEKQNGMLYYTLDDGMARVLNYHALQHSDWYLLSVVPQQVARSQMKQAWLMVGVIVLLFLLLIGMILILNKRGSEQLQRLAFVDPVTGGFSRTRFEMEGSKAVRAAPPGSYTLVSLDLQKFKLINDAFGSAEGDRTLKYVHEVIKGSLGPGEYLSRTSADHFNLLVYKKSQEETLRLVRGIARTVNRYNEKLEQKYYLPITAGAYLIDDPQLPMVYIQDRANVARKFGKESRVGQMYSCVFYSDLERRRMLREKELENRMGSALDNREFVVYLQPKVELEHDAIVGAEALVRWQDPERGLLPPSEFIPFFERNGFIVQLDLYVFEEVCRLLRRWIDCGVKPVPVSVNLSQLHLRDPDFLRKYQSIQQRFDVPPELLEIELTESLAFESMDRLQEMIDEIHAIGFCCSLDDFGSGYSSLNMLKDVSVDAIKLDREFFSGLGGESEREQRVIESVIELTKKLGVRSVCEGVETASQLEFLRRVKCDALQGYIVSKPLPPEAFEKMAFGAPVGRPGEDGADIPNVK